MKNNEPNAKPPPSCIHLITSPGINTKLLELPKNGASPTGNGRTRNSGVDTTQNTPKTRSYEHIHRIPLSVKGNTEIEIAKTPPTPNMSQGTRNASKAPKNQKSGSKENNRMLCIESLNRASSKDVVTGSNEKLRTASAENTKKNGRELSAKEAQDVNKNGKERKQEVDKKRARMENKTDKRLSNEIVNRLRQKKSGAASPLPLKKLIKKYVDPNQNVTPRTPATSPMHCSPRNRSNLQKSDGQIFPVTKDNSSVKILAFSPTLHPLRVPSPTFHKCVKKKIQLASSHSHLKRLKSPMARTTVNVLSSPTPSRGSGRQKSSSATSTSSNSRSKSKSKFRFSPSLKKLHDSARKSIMDVLRSKASQSRSTQCTQSSGRSMSQQVGASSNTTSAQLVSRQLSQQSLVTTNKDIQPRSSPDQTKKKSIRNTSTSNANKIKETPGLSQNIEIPMTSREPEKPENEPQRMRSLDKLEKDDDLKFERKFRKKKPMKPEKLLTSENMINIWKKTPLEQLIEPSKREELDPWESTMDELEKSSNLFDVQQTDVNTAKTMFNMVVNEEYKSSIEKHIEQKLKQISGEIVEKQDARSDMSKIVFQDTVKRKVFSVSKNTVLETNTFHIDDLPQTRESESTKVGAIVGEYDKIKISQGKYKRDKAVDEMIQTKKD